MSDFRIVEVIDGNTIKVSPHWEVDLKDHIIKGNRIYIRGLEGLENNPVVKKRVEKILLNSIENITFDAPEVIESTDQDDAMVSCSVYISRTNIVYYFPEFVSKH